MVKAIRASSQLVSYYSNDLIDSSMIEHGKLLLHLEFGFPEQSILEVIEVLRSDCESKQLKFELKLESIQNLQMKFDKQRLQQVVLNVAKNAIKFSHVNG